MLSGVYIPQIPDGPQLTALLSWHSEWTALLAMHDSIDSTGKTTAMTISFIFSFSWETNTLALYWHAYWVYLMLVTLWFYITSTRACCHFRHVFWEGVILHFLVDMSVETSVGSVSVQNLPTTVITKVRTDFCITFPMANQTQSHCWVLQFHHHSLPRPEFLLWF